MAFHHSRFRLDIPFSFSTVVVAAGAASVALGASASTSALLVLLGAVPLGVALLLGGERRADDRRGAARGRHARGPMTEVR